MTPRPLTPDDADALLPLVQGLVAHHGEVSGATAATLARDLGDGWIWGFGIGDPLAGYVLILPHARPHHGLRGAVLNHIYVAPDHRRRGLARLLIETAEADARDRGCAYVRIAAHTGNETARTTYGALGYEFTESSFWQFQKTL